VELKTVSAGTMICRQGDPGDGFFMIKSGKVRVYRVNEGMQTDLAILGPGNSFEEMALLTGAPRSANVMAVEPVGLMSLSKEQFDTILKTYPVVALALVKQMASWLIESDRMIEREHSRRYKAPRLSVFDFVVLIFLSGLFALIFNHSNPNGIPLFPKISLSSDIHRITIEAALLEQKNGTTCFVDAMPSDVYDREHIAGAVNIPLSMFDIMYMIGLSDMNKSRKIIVYGRTISRLYDIAMANKLYLRGHKNIAVLEGGLSLWKNKGYPLAP